MNGKELKVVEYNLSFGGKERKVNVFSLFRYQKNNGLYVIYADVGTTYNIINYGTSHMKENTILSMTPHEKDIEIIKEYIFKVTNNEPLEEFEILPLDNITSIEIISSEKLEIKPEVLASLTEKTIPKKETPKEEKKEIVKKKNPAKTLFTIIIIFAIFGCAAYIFLLTQNKETVTKMASCKKTTTNLEISAKIEETIEYNFNNDTLEKIDTTQVFKFNTKEDYEDFINKGTMYKYMPDDAETGGYQQNDEESTFTITKKENITSSYNKPTHYEEVLSYNKSEGYTCEEKILGE